MLKLIFLFLFFEMFNCFLMPNINSIFHNANEIPLLVNNKLLIQDQITLPIINHITNFVPNIDSIGHKVVLLDKNLIINLIDNEMIPIEFKKEIILTIIKLTQQGDNFGSIVLENYYKLMDFVL